MTRTMHDSVTVNDIPRNAEMVAGYYNGHYANLTAMRKRFPHVRVVSVTPSGEPGANVVDRETGDVDAPTAARWAAEEIKAGRTPTIYMNRSSWPQVRTAVAKAGLRAQVGVVGTVQYWVADWTGRPHMLDGAVACQYADPETSGGHYDLSLVADFWPGVDPAPKPKPTPAKPTPKPQTLTPLRPVTRFFLVYATGKLAKRTRPVSAGDAKVLAAAAEQCQRVQGIKA